MSIIGQNILAGASGAGAYTIDQSVRFDAGSATNLTRTPGSASNQKTWTFSAWVKRSTTLNNEYIFASTTAGTDSGWFTFEWRSTGEISLVPGYDYNQYATDQFYRDVSAWYHLVLRCDTTQSTWATRLRLYVNNELQTIRVVSSQSSGEPGVNADFGINQAGLHNIGKYSGGTLYLNCYMAEVHFVDGTSLAPTSFGEVNEDTNQWVPIKYAGTYGTNGFYLKMQDSTDYGDDSSGNNNDWTDSGFAATDQMVDTPTNNFATINPLAGGNGSGGGQTLSEGNLKDTSQTDNTGIPTTFGIPSSGKWYFEWYIPDYGATSFLGIYAPEVVFLTEGDTTKVGFWQYSGGSGNIYGNGAYPAYGTAWGVDGNLVGVAVDMDNGALYFSLNGTWQNSGVPTSGASKTGAAAGDLLSTGYDWVPCFKGHNPSYQSIVVFNAGQDSSFAGGKTAQGNSDANGIGDFYYTPPTDYLALCSSNFPDPVITLPAENFNTILYAGNSSAGHAITGVGFSSAPDFVWIKNRTTTENHTLCDIIRGTGNHLRSDSTAAQIDSLGLTSFDSDGFTLPNHNQVNGTGYDYVAWNWLAGGSGSANTDGGIDSTVSANTTAGFSIVKYTGEASQDTVGHGLAEAPSMVIIKRSVGGVGSWITWGTPLTNGSYALVLNTNAAEAAAGWSGTNDPPTATTFSIANNSDVNASGSDYISYCFHSVEGYSKVGWYSGNGNANGAFIYTGFRPAYVMYKCYNQAEDWYLLDDKRDTYNVVDKSLIANSNAAEVTTSASDTDFVSNGFKLRTSTSGNWSGYQWIYLAFAESPFKYANAR